MARKKFKIEYHGSIFLLILCFLLFFPIGLFLLFTKSNFEMGDAIYSFQYDGSTFWFCFWLIFFFPIAVLLLFINGFSVIQSDFKN